MVPTVQVGPVPPLIAVAARIQRTLDSLGRGNCVIGGIALLRWGEPRFTRDVDLTVLCPFGEEQALAEAVLASFRPRIPDAARFAAQSRVLLLEDAEGRPIDLALGALAYEERVISRSSIFEFAVGVPIRTCSAEDLVIMKAFANRGQDWVDVQGIATRRGESLDWSLVDEELAPLAALKSDPAIVKRVLTIRESSGRTT